MKEWGIDFDKITKSYEGRVNIQDSSNSSDNNKSEFDIYNGNDYFDDSEEEELKESLINFNPKN